MADVLVLTLLLVLAFVAGFISGYRHPRIVGRTPYDHR